MGSDAPSGFIFGCTNATEAECRAKKLFGLPPRHIHAVSKIPPGTPVFLYNYEARVLHGVFESKCKGGWELDPIAWSGRFPAQIRVRGIGIYPHKGECLVADVFSEAIRRNYFSKTRFTYALSERQVAKLQRLFYEAGWQPSWSARWMRHRHETRRERAQRRKTETLSSGGVRKKSTKLRRSPRGCASPEIQNRRRSTSPSSIRTDAMDYVMDCDVPPPVDAKAPSALFDPALLPQREENHSVAKAETATATVPSAPPEKKGRPDVAHLVHEMENVCSCVDLPMRPTRCVV